MAYASGAVCLLASVYITLDVIGRRFLGVSSGVTDEIGGYALAIGGMWALGHALRSGAHVRIDVLLPHLPDRLQTLLHYAALGLMAYFAALLAYYCGRLAIESYRESARAMSILQTPLAVPQGLMAAGVGVLALQAAALIAAGLAQSLRAGRLLAPDAAAPAGTGRAA
jgi:TRAP-type C4-dicarboxylate transport system permease small subunit